MQTLSVRIPDELKRLPSALKRALDAEIRKIAADPLRGDRKRGVLRDVKTQPRRFPPLGALSVPAGVPAVT